MAKGPLLLGFDLGSSSVKAAVLDAGTGLLVGAATAPAAEMPMASPQPGWAEQDPEMWWTYAMEAGRMALQRAQAKGDEVAAIGIAYQMHGLVLVDAHHRVLRPSIIWCDSRAVATGAWATQQLGEAYCLSHLLNTPGNFTASKLRWVREHEPALYRQIHKAMLPGDYLAMRLTGEIATTVSGLSEGIFWDFQERQLAGPLLRIYDIDPGLLAPVVPTFGLQGKLSRDAADALGVAAGTPVTYRAGDQPNNAFSLGVLNPGEVAATAGTSGVIYGVTDQPTFDPQSRVNGFVHVNDSADATRLGILLCVNGTGIMNSWLRKTLGGAISYDQLNQLASSAPIGSDGLRVLPFGNGAERVLSNQNPGATFRNLDFNRHSMAHVSRAVQEGIVFALGYGFEVLRDMRVHASVIRAGRANLFLSDVFCQAFVHVTGARLELLNTDGAQGAARGAGVGAGIYPSVAAAFGGLTRVTQFEPEPGQRSAYQEAFAHWKEILHDQLD
jgi:xylulokinase